MLLLSSTLFRFGLVVAILLESNKLYGVASVGNLSAAIAITTPIFIVSDFALRTLYLTKKGTVRDPKVYWLARFMGTSCAWALIILISFFLSPTLVLTLVAISLYKTVDSLLEGVIAPLQFQKKYLAITSLAVATSGVGFLAFLGLALSGTSMDQALFGIAVGQGVVLAVRAAFSQTKKRIIATRSRDAGLHTASLQLISQGAPQSFAIAALSLVVVMPQYFLLSSWGTIEVAHFAISTYSIFAFELLIGAVVQAWIPAAREISYTSAPENSWFATTRKSQKWTFIFIPLAIVGMIVFKFGTRVFLEIEISWEMLIPLIIWATLLPMIFFNELIMQLKNQYRRNMTVAIVTASCSLLFCALLIPEFGLIGAIWAACLSSVSRLLLASFLSRGRPSSITG